MIYDRILIIQTAFIGDVILATPLIERLYQKYPGVKIDFLLRKGNESLLKSDPRIHKLIIWDKRKGKYSQLFSLLRTVRAAKYDLVVNVQRFATMGVFTALSNARSKVGFDKSPFSLAFDKVVPHQVGEGRHEVERNLSLIDEVGLIRPSLHLDRSMQKAVANYQSEPYVTIAPTSVWFTKQFPHERWVELINQMEFEGSIFLLGGPDDFDACEQIRKESSTQKVINLAGKLSLLSSAALMKRAHMNYVNDSAPMHLASAVNAPVTVFYCSTVPAFGFGPLSDTSHIMEVTEALECRPCGLHGFKNCPRGHFNCALKMDISTLT
ncbi:MAG: putative lipopolysaccharide heptosyltransferase III [Paraglaciecola sp.]|jgi:predicted lipopolysaccharide heptosyltransferase III